VVEKKLQPALSKAMFGERVKHRVVELELLRDVAWPPLSNMPLAQVMENEAAVSSEFAQPMVKLLPYISLCCLS